MARFPGRGDARGRGLRGHQQSQAVTRLATPPASPPPRGVEGPPRPAGRGRQEAQYVALGQMTSSPTPTPHAKKALCSAAVPVLHPSAYRVPCQAANSFSNATVTSSPDIAPRRSTSSTARSCSSVMMGHRNRSSRIGAHRLRAALHGQGRRRAHRTVPPRSPPSAHRTRAAARSHPAASWSACTPASGHAVAGRRQSPPAAPGLPPAPATAARRPVHAPMHRQTAARPGSSPSPRPLP